MEAMDESLGTDRVAEHVAGEFGGSCPDISAYSTTETRTVFTESDNGDGWIATDLTVEIRE